MSSDKSTPRLNPTSKPSVDDLLLAYETSERIQTDAIESITRKMAKRREGLTRQALESTDWDETPIVDIVVEYPELTPNQRGKDMTPPTMRFHVQRYQHPPPKMDESAIDGSKCTVQRVTRPLWEKVEREYL